MNPIIANSALVDLNNATQQVLSLPWADKSKVTQAYNKFLLKLVERDMDEAAKDVDACFRQNAKLIDPKALKDIFAIFGEALRNIASTSPTAEDVLCPVKTSEPDAPVFIVSLKALERRFPQLAQQIKEGQGILVFENISSAALAEIVEMIENGKTPTREQTAVINDVVEKLLNRFFLTTSDPAVRPLAVPRAVLSRHSPFLVRILQTPGKESIDGKIAFDNLSPDALNGIVNFFIKGEADFSPDALLEIMHFSVQWECPLLKEACLKTLEAIAKVYKEIDPEANKRKWEFGEISYQRYMEEYAEAVEAREMVRDALVKFCTFAPLDKEIKTALLFACCNSPFGGLYEKLADLTVEELEGYEIAQLGIDLSRLPMKFERISDCNFVTIENLTPLILHNLSKLFKEDYKITHLNITCKDPLHAAQLAKLLRQFGKKSDLHSIAVTTDNEQVLQLIARAAVESTSIANLELTMNGTVTQAGLGESLKVNRKLESLKMTSQGLSPEVIQELANALEQNIPLKTLDLKDNHINEAGATALGAALKKNSNLKELQLEGNNLGLDGILALAPGVALNRGLTHLNLTATGANSLSMRALGDALETNKTLKWLALSRNDITDQGAIHLVSSLNKNTTLERLELRQTQVKIADVETLRPTINVNL